MENRFSQFIVDHTKYLVYQLRTAIEILLKPEGADGLDPFDTGEIVLVGDDLERFAPQWAYLVPDDPTTCAIIAHDFISNYELVYSRATQLRTALHLDTDTVKQAYEDRYGETIEDAMSDREQTLPRRVTRMSWIDEMTAYRIERELEWVDLKPKERLFASDTLYVVVSGQVRVSEDAVGEEDIVFFAGRGTIVGDRAMLGGDDFLATITAIRHAQLVKLTRASFYKLHSNHPQIMMGLIKALVNGTTRPDDLPSMRAVAVLPLHDSQQVDTFMSNLRMELTKMVDVLQLSAAQLDEQLYVGASQALGNKSLSQPVVSWLRERESLHDLVVYDLSDDDVDWARQAVQHVDRILLVADTGHSYEVTEIEKYLLTGLAVKIDLVLLHPHKNALPSGTRHWLERRKIDFHHHVAVDDANDARQLTRRFIGQSVGLALGSGITRAHSYCGVMRALTEPGISVDSIAATSFGSIPAAMMAMKADHQKCVEAMKRVLGTLEDRTLAVTSLVSGRRLSKALRDIFGDTRLEDLWIPLTLVSFDATHAAENLHQRGLVRDAIRASLSIPGVFPPVVRHKEALLIDGSIINPLPVNVVRRSINGTIIAVDCSVIEADHPQFDAVEDVSGWQLFWNRVNPLVSDKIDSPNIVELMSRMAVVAGCGQVNRQLAQADVSIRLPLENFAFFDSDGSQQIEEIGYRVTRDMIAQWLVDNPEFKGAVRS